MKFSLTDIVQGVFKPLMDTIDEVHTSEEERLQKKRELLETWVHVVDKTLTFEKAQFMAQAKIVEAEVKSDGVLARNWRPVTMLTFLVLAVGDSLGWLPNNLNEQAWTLLQLGLGGYVVGRSGEKIVRNVMESKATK